MQSGQERRTVIGIVPAAGRATRLPLALGLFETDDPARSDVVATMRQLDPAEKRSALITRVVSRTPVPAVRLGRLLDIGTKEALRHAHADPVVRTSHLPRLES